MDKDEEVVVNPQQSSKAMDEEGVDDDDPYGFLVKQCIIPSAEENQLRSLPLFSPTPTPTPTPSPTQQPPQPSPPTVVKHEQTGDEIDILMQQQTQQPLEMEKEKEKEKEATENMEVDDEEEESQSVTKEPTISVENSPPPFENEGFSQPAVDDDETPSPVTGEEELLQKIIVEEEESPLEQNEGLVVVAQPQSPPTKTQTEQTHFVPPRLQPAATATATVTAAVGVGVGVGASSSTNPQNPKEEDDTTIDILDVLRSKGFYVPRPRWWRPEGYDKP